MPVKALGSLWLASAFIRRAKRPSFFIPKWPSGTPESSDVSSDDGKRMDRGCIRRFSSSVYISRGSLGARARARCSRAWAGSVTVLGILVAAQPYIRKGVRQAGREQAGLEEARGDRQHPDAESKDAEAAGVRHVLKERVIGVALIGAGSILNAYGSAIASALKLRGS